MPFVNITSAGGIDKLHFNPAHPRLERDKVIVKLSYAGVNHIDIWVREGKAYKVDYPRIPGADGAGAVEYNPDPLSPLKPGTQVFVYPGISCGHCLYCLQGRENLCREYKIIGAATDGTYSSHIAANEKNLIPFQGIPMEQAAAFPLTYLTAYHAIITQGKLSAGDTILVNAGCSGLGLAAIDIARNAGASVIASVGSKAKEEYLKSIGITQVVNYNLERDWGKKVLEFTNGDGVDMVYDNIGTAAFENSLTALRPGGKLIVSGTTTGGAVNLDLRQLFSRDITLIGSRMGTRGELMKITSLFEEGKYHARIDRVFGLSDVQKAHEYMESREITGKILLSM